MLTRLAALMLAALVALTSVPAAAADTASYAAVLDEDLDYAAAETAASDLPEGQARSLLTGETVSAEQAARRPVAFMIDNVKDADPQSGTSRAALYYECEVEADLSRMCVVFDDYADLAKIGPLRSSRDYFISLTAGLDRIYTHYGQAAYALPYLESDEVDNLSGLMSYSYNAFFRDGPHSAPHNAYTSGEKISQLISVLGYRTEHEADYRPMLHFAAEAEADMTAGGREASYVELGYPQNRPFFVYDAETGLYDRYQYGGAHVDYENGEQLSVKNIILEYQSGTNYQQSSYLHYQTADSGIGKYISNGKAVDITWERADFYSPAVYRTADGEELVLNQGKTWVAVIRRNQLKNFLIGADADSAACAEDEAVVASEEAKMSSWVAEYKAGEEAYLTAMAQIRTDNVAKHGGTKVEVGLP